MNEYLFLYGTLLPTQAPKEIASIVKRFRRLGPARVRGKLYDFGEFPGAVLDSSTRNVIQGELVALPSDERILEALDRYEEFDPLDTRNSLFVRKKARVRMANGAAEKGGFTSTTDALVGPSSCQAVTTFVLEWRDLHGAGGRTRTDMNSEVRQILSLVRIPISPLRREGLTS